jgi:hypothetical protein
MQDQLVNINRARVMCKRNGCEKSSWRADGRRVVPVMTSVRNRRRHSLSPAPRQHSAGRQQRIAGVVA